MRGLVRGLLLLAVVGVSALFGVACSTSDESATTTTSESVAPTTAEPTTSTAAPTSSTSTTLSQLEQDRRAVYEVHTRFMTEFFAYDARIPEDLDRAQSVLNEVATGAQLERSQAALERERSNEVDVVSPGFDSNVIEITISDERAVVLDCSEDQSVVLDATGEVVTPRDGFHLYQEVHLLRVPGGWRIEDSFAGGDERCEPAELDVLSY